MDYHRTRAAASLVSTSPVTVRGLNRSGSKPDLTGMVSSVFDALHMVFVVWFPSMGVSPSHTCNNMSTSY